MALQSVRTRTLGAAHVEFLQCAILAGQYRFARRVVGDEWPRPDRATTADQVLRYFYLRGVLHIGCDEFRLAIRCLWTVLSVPAGAVSPVAVDAWKKLVLVKSLVCGNTVAYQALVAPPAAASNAVARHFTASSTSSPSPTGAAPAARPSTPTAVEMTGAAGRYLVNEPRQDATVTAYLELVKACHGGDRKAYGEQLTKHATLLQEDDNMELAQRLAVDLQHRHLRLLSTLYVSVPATQVVAELSIPMEDLAPMLTQVEGLSAEINSDGMVTFQQAPPVRMDAGNLRSLITLSARIRKLDTNLASSSRYQHAKGEDSKMPLGIDDF